MFHYPQHPDAQHRPCRICHDVHRTGEAVVQEDLLSQLDATGSQESAEHDPSPMECGEGQRCQHADRCKQQNIAREFHKAVIDELWHSDVMERKQYGLQSPGYRTVNWRRPERHEREGSQIQSQ